MYKCTPKEIISAVPGVQSVYLDASWFNELDPGKTVFVSLYDWMTQSGRIPDENHKTLHNRTYVSDRIFKKLLAAEKIRIRKKHRLKGDDLDEAVSWSDFGSGPRSEICGCRITGDVILVIPEDSSRALREFSIQLLRKARDKHINKMRTNAAGAEFYGWLVSQIKRPDRVGDLARDAESCQEFPRARQDYEGYLSFAQEVGSCDGAIESLGEAWLEYARQYPERINPAAWCNECGKKIPVEAAQLAWEEDSGEIFILDARCLEKYRSFSSVEARALSELSWDGLDAVAEKHDLSEWDMKRVIEKLLLWGVLSQPPEGTIYFLKCEQTKEIKIGFTAGQVEKRQATLQTARSSQLTLLATMRGSTKFEQELHKRFDQWRLKGEWFSPHPDILAFIIQLQGEDK